MKRSLLALAVLVVAVSPGVRAGDARLDRVKVFYRLPLLQRMAAFRDYAVAEQLEIFFYGNQRRHPPAQELAVCYALNGASGAVLLRDRLAEPVTDLDIRDIALLSKEMQTYGTYDVRGDAILMDRLQARMASMHDKGWQETTANLLHGIQTVSPRALPSRSPCLGTGDSGPGLGRDAHSVATPAGN